MHAAKSDDHEDVILCRSSDCNGHPASFSTILAIHPSRLIVCFRIIILSIIFVFWTECSSLAFFPVQTPDISKYGQDARLISGVPTRFLEITVRTGGCICSLLFDFVSPDFAEASENNLPAQNVKANNNSWNWAELEKYIIEITVIVLLQFMFIVLLLLQRRRSVRTGKELSESEERLRQVTQNAGQWIWEVDAAGLYKSCSPGVEKILGYTSAELIGRKHFYDLFAPEEMQTLKEEALKAFERKEPFQNFINRNLHKDCRIVILETSGSPVVDGKGNLLGYQGVDMDITLRKRAEDMLKRQLAFGKLINKIHDRLARASGGEIDSHIRKTLQEIGRFIDVDSVFVIQLSADRTLWSWTYEWNGPQAPSFLMNYQHIPVETFKWSEKLLRHNKILLMRSLDDLPPEAAFERQRYDLEGVKSMLSVPLHGREKMVIGGIGFRSYSRRIMWSRVEDIRWLRMVGDVVASALERKRFEEELLNYRNHLEQLVEERTKRLKLVLESGQFEIWSWSAETNSFTVSEGAADMIGIDSVSGKIISRERYRQFIHHDDLPGLTELRDAAYRGDIDQYQSEYRLRHKDKGWIWVMAIVVVESRAANNTATRMSGLIQDITIRKEAEAALKKYSEDLEEMVRLRTAELTSANESLRDSEALFRTSFENATVGVCLIGADGKFISVNNNLCKMLGYTQEELRGKTFSAVTYSEDRAIGDSFVKSALLGEVENATYEKRYISKDENIVWAQVSSAFVNNPAGDFQYFITHVQDITERKKAEEEKRRLESQLLQSQKMEAIGTLAGGIAHDFNNILGGILGYVELAQRRHITADHPASRYIDGVLTGINRASDLISQIMTFSRFEEHKRKPLEMMPLIKEALKLLRAILPSTIEIRQNIVSSQRAIMADPTQIHQVVMNLCTNAAHAMKERGGILEVSLCQVAFESDLSMPHHDLKTGVEYDLLIVRDTGYGIDKEIINRIFDPFFTTKKTGEGTGLGLAVVYGIIRNHGGAITVESKPGQGSVFCVYIPTISQLKEELEKSQSAISGGKERILFVDDETALTAIFKIQLEDLGYSVDVHNDPQVALDAFRRNPLSYDLVITDMTMPHMVGTDLATKLSQVRSDIPVILCTGVIDKIEQEYLHRCGICDMILKPISIKKLAQEIRQVLGENSSGVDQR